MKDREAMSPPTVPTSREYEASWTCYPAWAVNCLLDPRVVHNIPCTLLRTSRRRRQLATVPAAEVVQRQPWLALTFDIEHDPCYGAESARSDTAAPFLRALVGAGAGTDLPFPATFFVQGEMVQDLTPHLSELADRGHVIGLHGYRHELWGRNNWVKRRPPITRPLRRERLELSLANFERALLPRPIAWRAPIFTLDEWTYGLLAEYGFTTDSSVATQRGSGVAPHLRAGLRVVPVSCAPLTEVRKGNRLPIPIVAFFYQFDYNTLIDTPDAFFASLVDETLRWQVARGLTPHLVVYGHNWEFQRGDAQRNLRTLVDRLQWLVETYGMRSATLPIVADKLIARSPA